MCGCTVPAGLNERRASRVDGWVDGPITGESATLANDDEECPAAAHLRMHCLCMFSRGWPRVMPEQIGGKARALREVSAYV